MAETKEEIEMDKEELAKKEGIVFVGDKPIGQYLLPAMKHITDKGEVVIKARGRAIPKAIGLTLRLQEQMNLKTRVEIGSFKTTVVENDKERNIKVAEIEITLKRE